MTHTSRMAAITTPSRFGYEIVDVFFGEVRVRSDQTLAMINDLLRDGGGLSVQFPDAVELGLEFFDGVLQPDDHEVFHVPSRRTLGPIE